MSYFLSLPNECRKELSHSTITVLAQLIRMSLVGPAELDYYFMDRNNAFRLSA